MATTTATLAVKVTADASQAAAGLDKVSSSAGGFQSGINKAAGVAAAGGLALAAFGKQAFDAASQAQQASGAVDAAFGGSAEAIHKFAKTSSDSVGLASGDYEAMAATFGAQLKNMGVASDKLAPTTNDLIGLGADLAAQFGGSTADAVGALGSLMRGETDPIEKYGVSIKQADIEAKKAEMGLTGLTGAADKQATTQATLALLTDQTAAATGAFAREADTAAGQQQRANAKFEDAAAAIGEALLPVVSELAEWMGKLGDFVKQNKSAFTAFGAALAVVAGAVLALKVGTMAWNAAQLVARGATMAWQAAQWLLNAAMTANPIGLVVAAVAALTAGIVLVVKNWDKVTAAFTWFMAWIKANWPKLLAIITGPFGVAVLVIIRNRDKIVKALRKVLDVARAIFRKIADIAKTVFRAIANVAKNFYNAVRSIFRKVGDVATAVFRKVRDVARSAFDAIRNAIGRTIDTVRRIIDVVRNAFSNAWRAVRDVARSILDAIRAAIGTTIDKVRAIIDWVRNRLGDAWRAMRDTARNVLDAIKGFIQWPIDKATDLYNYIKDTLTPVWDTLEDAASTALNLIMTPITAVRDGIQWIIEKVNALLGLLPSIKFPSVPSWVPIIGKSAPTTPAPARYAAPAIGARTLGAAGRSTSSAGGITINVTGALDPDAVARQIERILTARARRVGGVRRVA